MTDFKLNLGCGVKHLSGWVNVDRDARFNPDQVHNLEELPWPWATSSVREVLLSHVLEHLGQSSDTFLAIIQELWRVCCHNALITIMVPHVRSDAFLADPTHVRPILAEGLALFDQRANRHWLERQQSNTPLGLMLGVDFRIEAVNLLLTEPWIAKLKKGEITEAGIDEAARTFGNVVEEVTIRWRVVKADDASVQRQSAE
ncbi:MAG: hypothetical protein HYR63_25530 [Proteobacteria bacterium]|nr:hypothetical protein [Pseudomonadota bacterium]MBI3497293.1 hypothetical protein [Pseudomonadota bacterium]